MNGAGSVGDGSTIDRRSPVAVASGMTKISASGFHSMALKNDGTVWLWGNGAGGQLGNGSTASKFVPTKEQSLSSIMDIATGGEHSVAIQNDGLIWAWGRGGYGQLGNGFYNDSNVPVQTQFVTPGLTTSMDQHGINPPLDDEQLFDQEYGETLPDRLVHEVVDMLKPTDPLGLSIKNNSDDGTMLVWDASSDNVGVVSYNIYSNQEIIGSTKDTTFRFNKETKGTYIVSVTAVDAEGNESKESSPIIIEVQ